MMDFSHCVQQPLGVTDGYASLLAKLSLSFRLPIPPPDLIRECLRCKPRNLSDAQSDNQSFEAPVNLCIRDQKPKSAFVSVGPRSSNRVDSLSPEVWTVPRMLTGCEAPMIPLKVREYPCEIPPTRRRAGWKGLSVCAACFRPFSKMSDLNLHYIQKHKNLLDQEWAAALIKRQRRCCKTSNRRLPICDQTLTPKEVHVSGSTTDGTVKSQAHSLETMCGRLLTGKAEKSPRKSHVCPWCSYCAKWPTELQKHIAVHANSRPYACLICSNCYKWSWDLGRHFSTVHAGLPNPYKMNKRSLRAQTQRSNCGTTAI